MPPNSNSKVDFDASNPGDFVLANGERIPASFPCTIEAFLTQRGLRPKSVVVELNGEAVAPSEFVDRRLKSGDRLEVVQIVAGG